MGSTQNSASNSALHRKRSSGRSIRKLALVTVMFTGLVGGCASQMLESSSDDAQNIPSNTEIAASSPQAEASHDAIAGADVGENAATVVADVPEAAPQLVKRAELALEIEDVDEAIQQTMAIARSLGGDVLTLRNQMPPSETVTHTAFLELRVPQNQLGDGLSQLSELGTVERQTLTAEDVSAQLVDFEARLRNLRKAEEMTLGIMERSGEIGEVLQVAQELRTIREAIEQIDGQLSTLQTQIRYSTISLTLTRPGSSTPSQSGILSQLRNSWRQSTRSMASLTINVIQLGIWILVYSPYWLAIGVVTWVGVKLLKRNTGDTQASQNQSTS